MQYFESFFEVANAIFDYSDLITEKYVMWYSEILYQHSKIRKTQPTVPASSKLTSNRFYQVPVRLSPRPPWSIHSGVVSEKNERRTHFFARILFQKFTYVGCSAKNYERKSRGDARREKASPHSFRSLFFRAAPQGRGYFARTT